MTSANYIQSDKQWHLDKRVPVALILALAIQGAGGVWWAASTNQRLDDVERRIDGFSTRTEAMRATLSDQGQTIAVLLSRIDDTNRNLDRLRTEVQTTNSLLRQLIAEPRE